MDESDAGGSGITRAELQQWLLEVWSEIGSTVLLITHDVAEAVFLADRVYVMSPLPGRVKILVRTSLGAEYGIAALPAVNPVPQTLQAGTGNQGLGGVASGQPQQNILGNLPPSLGNASQAALAQLPEPRLGSRFDQAELRIGQTHILANLLGRFLVQVEADQYLTVAFGDALENAHRQADILARDGLTLGVGTLIGYRFLEIHVYVVASHLHGAIDMRRHLAADHRMYIAHQPFGFAQIAIADGLGDDHEDVVHLIVQVLGSQLPV